MIFRPHDCALAAFLLLQQRRLTDVLHHGDCQYGVVSVESASLPTLGALSLMTMMTMMMTADMKSAES